MNKSLSKTDLSRLQYVAQSGGIECFGIARLGIPNNGNAAVWTEGKVFSGSGHAATVWEMESPGFVRWYFDRPPFDGGEVIVNGLGYRERHMPYFVNRPDSIHRDYLLMHFPEEVWICDHTCAPGQPRLFPPNTLIVWPPRGPNFYGLQGRRWEHSWLHCGGHGVEKLFTAFEVPIGEAFSFPQAELFEAALLDIHRELVYFHKPDPEVILWNLKVFFNRLRRCLLSEDGYHRIPQRYLALKSDLEDRYMHPVNVADLAREVSCSPGHLARKFKEYFGTGIREYLITVRMRNALYLLQDRHYNVTEIGERVGYPTVFSFSKQFKLRYGCSPTEMRRRLDSESLTESAGHAVRREPSSISASRPSM